jgi:cytochrome c551/c552
MLEQCKQAAYKKKNKAIFKWLQQKMRASHETYKKLRMEANVLIRQKKKAWINNKTTNRM